MAHVKGVLAFAFITINTVWWSIPIYVMAAIRVLTPWDGARRTLSAAMTRMIDGWVGCNRWMLAALRVTRIEEDWAGAPELRPDGWHVVISNHQGWSDILVLQTTFLRRIPPLKFFVKQVLIWVPGVGLAMWLMDFPFVRRFPRTELEANPSLREIDRLATLAACERFKHRPTTALSFLEGTRFTPEKRQAQGSQYEHLLMPKTGGFGYVVAALGTRVDKATDVTIFYPEGVPTFWEFLCGKCPIVRIEIRARDIPDELQVGGDELSEPARERLKRWVTEVWEAKDARLDELIRVGR